jgi:hypothetical protein
MISRDEFEQMTADEQERYILDVRCKLVEFLRAMLFTVEEIADGMPALALLTALAQVAAESLPEESEPMRAALADVFVRTFHATMRISAATPSEQAYDRCH